MSTSALHDPLAPIAAAVADHGMSALRSVAPLAFEARLADGYAPADDATFTERCVMLRPVAAPLFDAALVEVVGCERVSERTWVLSVGKDAEPARLEALLGVLDAHQVIREADLADLDATRRRRRSLGHRTDVQPVCTNRVIEEVAMTPAGVLLGHARVVAALRADSPCPADAAQRARAALVISIGQGRLWVKLITTGTPAMHLRHGGADLGLLRAKVVRDPSPLRLDEAIEEIHAIEQEGHVVIDPDGRLTIARDLMEDSVTCQRVSGSPARARVVIGRGTGRVHPGVVEHDSGLRIGEVPAHEALTLIATHRRGGGHGVSDPQVEDVARMALASGEGTRAGLRPYQDEACALMAATTVGMVNACAPGLGKTPMTLTGLKEQAEARAGWRGLVVVPSPILTQWCAEAGRFFPGALTIPVTRTKDLPTAMCAALWHPAPAMLVMSYDTARKGADALAARRWDAVVLDEAAILKSTASKRTHAMWQIRKSANTAFALTGTPIERSLDDLGRIVAWARGDEEMFHGVRLSGRFAATDEDFAQELWSHLGPVVFRRDRSEIADELPRISTETVLIDPTPAERALAEGARTELKRLYEDLLARVEQARELDPDDPDLAEAQEELRRARGACLGGVTLARAAASDPASLADSTSPAAALLDQAGLLQPALANGGTKREAVVQMTGDLVARGEAVLIFTDFARVAERLVSDLAGAGVKVGLYAGSKSARREQAQADFQRGELDCLVLTSAGREGLNLQRASTVVHFDLPWLPTQIVQRVGRAARIGSRARELQVVVPLMAGTIEERVAALLVPRALTALLALDAHRGVRAKDTDLGQAIEGLPDVISDDAKQGDESLFDLAARLLAA